jgi:hypothetical protein
MLYYYNLASTNRASYGAVHVCDAP